MFDDGRDDDDCVDVMVIITVKCCSTKVDAVSRSSQASGWNKEAASITHTGLYAGISRSTLLHQICRTCLNCMDVLVCDANCLLYIHVIVGGNGTRSQAATRIADRTAKNCRGHVT